MIKIFDKDLNFLGFFENFNSFQCTTKYTDCGQFKLKALLTPASEKMLKVGNFLQFEDFSGIIDGIQKKEKAHSTPLIEAVGLDLNSLLKSRIIWEDVYFSGFSEDFLRKIVMENAINPTNRNRIIPFLSLAGKANLPQKTERNTQHETLLRECQKVCRVADYGFRTTLDAKNKKILFGVYSGEDRTAGKPNQIIIGKDYDNVVFQNYTFSRRDELTTGIIGKEGIPLVTVGDKLTGFDRKEVFVKASDKQQDQSDEQYNNSLKTAAKEKTKKSTECFDIDTINVNLNVGDLVTVKDKKWNLQFDTRVAEKTITIDKGVETSSYVLGEDIDSIEEKEN